MFKSLFYDAQYKQANELNKINALTFNQHNVHRIVQQVNLSLDLTKISMPDAIKKDDLFKLAIYCLFYLRNATLAEKYVASLKKLDITDAFEYAKMKSLEAECKLIPGLQLAPALFQIPIDIYTQIGGDETQKEIAFCLRGLAYIKHRQAYQLQDEIKKLEQKGDLEEAQAMRKEMHSTREAAIADIEIALNIAKRYSMDPDYPYFVAMADYYHALGAILGAAGELAKSTIALDIALTHWESEREVNKITHIHMFVTQQNLAMNFIRQQKYQEALKLLEPLLHDQKAHLGVEIHNDIAKTLHFIGEAQLGAGLREDAYKTVSHSKQMKEILGLQGTSILQVTQDLLDKFSPEEQANFDNTLKVEPRADLSAPKN